VFETLAGFASKGRKVRPKQGDNEKSTPSGKNSSHRGRGWP